jgi:hypothetical protein
LKLRDQNIVVYDLQEWIESTWAEKFFSIIFLEKLSVVY